MKGITIEERACLLARYIIDSKDTVRGAAKKFRDFQKYCAQGCERKTYKDKSSISSRGKENTRRK